MAAKQVMIAFTPGGRKKSNSVSAGQLRVSDRDRWIRVRPGDRAEGQD